MLNYYNVNKTSTRKTAKYFNIDRKTLAAWTKGKFPQTSKNEIIKSPNRHKRCSQKTISVASKLFKNGFTPNDIVKQLNLSEVSVLCS